MRPIEVQFKDCPSLYPNSGAQDTVTARFVFKDAAGIEGTVTATGKKVAMNNLDETFFVSVDGTSGNQNVATPFGTVTIVSAFPGGYVFDDNVLVELQVTDHLGWQSVEGWCGWTDRIMTELGECLVDENGEAILHIKKQF